MKTILFNIEIKLGFMFLIVYISIIFGSCAWAETQPAKVRPWLVKDIRFSGNMSISSGDLLAVMDTKASWFFHKVRFSQSMLNADIDAIVDLYRSKGFLDVKIDADSTVKDRTLHKVFVDITVREGPQTIIDSMAFNGTMIMGVERIKRFVTSKPGAPYSEAILFNDEQRIRDSLAAYGYRLCTVGRADTVDSMHHTAAVAFRVDQGPLVVAGPFVLRGQKKLREVIVKKGLTFAPGDTITSSRIRLSISRMYETGMLKYVQISTLLADSGIQRTMTGPVTLPVHVDIEEADFYKLQGGVGYGTYEGVRLSLQTSYGNVQGMGRTIGLDGKYSRLVQSLHMRYTVPWFFLLPPTAEFEVYGEHHDEVTFAGYLEGLTLSLYAKTSGDFAYRAFSTFEWVNGVANRPLTPTAAPLLHTNNTQSFGNGFTWDIRDNIFDPTHGMLVTTDAELAGLLGVTTNHFYKFLMDARGYVPATSTLVVATALAAGYVNGYGVDKAVVPPQELLYTGSSTIRLLRGYAPGGVSDTLGGRLALVLNALELRYSVSKWLVLAAFADAGFVWMSALQFSLKDLRWTAGPGIRIRTPIGLLSTDIGVRLSGPTAGKTGFSINIGEPF